jgi:hypothetical protein|eukprot:COSAG06_NODE_423_length_15942_cov_7.276463_3_plen_248_part_00
MYAEMAGGYGDLAGSQPTPSGDHDGSHQVGDLGCEGVGVVIARGSAAMDVELGQAVAFMGYGLSFREFTTIKAGGDIVNSQIAFPVPDASASWVGVPCSALTATGGLELEGKLSSLPAGSTVLVTGAAGGTGHIAVQWAAMKGMRVAGTCGDEVKAAMLRELGCDVVVNCKLRHAVASHHRASPSPRNAPTKHRTAVYIPVDRSYGFLSAPTDSDLPCLPYSGRGRPHAGCGSGAGQRISRWLHGCV